MKQLVTAATLFSALALGGGAPARASSEFGSCPAVLPACGGTTVDCCYQTFPQSGADGPIIIPMDRCHQRLSPMPAILNDNEATPTAAAAWCANPPAAGDGGMLQAYGLVYRLMQANIPVYWIVNPSKDPPILTTAQWPLNTQSYDDRDIDFWVLSAGASVLNLGDLITAAAHTCAVGVCTPPIKHLTSNFASAVAANYLTNDAAYTYSKKEFPVRGGAFVIAASDVAAMRTFLATKAGNANYNFAAVDMYMVNAASSLTYLEYAPAAGPYAAAGIANSLPIAYKLLGPVQRLARSTGGDDSHTDAFLTAAKLNIAAGVGCKTGGAYAGDAVYCSVNDTEIQSGVLLTGNFQYAWLGDSGLGDCSNAVDKTNLIKVEDYMTAQPGVRAGGNALFFGIRVDEHERCANLQPQGTVSASRGLAGITGISPTEPVPGGAISGTVIPVIDRYPTSLFLQFGDVPINIATESGVNSWTYWGGGANGYDATHTAATGSLQRLLTYDTVSGADVRCTRHKSSPTCDIQATSAATAATSDSRDMMSYVRYKENASNGIAVYLAGEQIFTTVTSNRMMIRLALNSLLALPRGTPTAAAPVVTTTEVSRASPIIATVGGVEAQYQGSYEVVTPSPTEQHYLTSADNAAFEFPYTKGHMRAVATSNISTTATAFTALATTVFDAATGIPAVTNAGCASDFAGTCRSIFTTTTTPDATGLAHVTNGTLTKVFFKDGNAAALKSLLGITLDADSQTLIERVLAGVKVGAAYVSKLGGVDRSTVAVIDPSPLAGLSTRPTMVYFGATDGMLHAVCANAVAPCPAAGKELWAFIPRTQLGLLRLNQARVDGSPKVADVFDDFNGTGIKAWKTILTFQTGNGSSGTANQQPSVFALDITDPASPGVLWERSTPATRGTQEQGLGMGLAMGPVRVGSQFENMTFVQTRNGGTATAAGFYLAGIDVVTGTPFWTVKYTYPDPRNGADPVVPITGVPGGAVVVDRDRVGTLTHVLVGDLYGEVFELKAADGSDPFGTTTATIGGASTTTLKPLFAFSSDFHPVGAAPLVYADLATGRLNAVAVSGGYADPVDSSWASTVNQFAVSFDLDPSAANVPIDDTGGTFGTDRNFVIDLGINRAYAQAQIAGSELFITTDSADVNATTYGGGGNTGLLGRYNAYTGAEKTAAGGTGGTPTAIAGGASSVAVSGSTVYTGSSSSVQKMSEGSFVTAGSATEIAANVKATRRLWISQ